MMHRHQFRGFAVDMAHRMMANPYTAINVLDDVVGPSNARAMIPFVGYSAAKAQRGERLATATAGTTSLLAMPLMGSMIEHGLGFALPAVGGPAGFVLNVAAMALLTSGPSELLRHSVYRGMRSLQQFDRRVRRLEMGGRYEDSETKAALRATSVREMSAALGAPRRYLGNEALLFHE